MCFPTWANAFLLGRSLGQVQNTNFLRPKSTRVNLCLWHFDRLRELGSCVTSFPMSTNNNLHRANKWVRYAWEGGGGGSDRGGPKIRDVFPPANKTSLLFLPPGSSRGIEAAGHGHGPPKLCIWASLGGHCVRAVALTRTSTSNRWLSQRSTVAATPDVGTTPSMFARGIEVEMFWVMTFRLRPNVREWSGLESAVLGPLETNKLFFFL